MKRDFFRKMGFGIAPGDQVPTDPVAWADAQLDTVPALSWGDAVPTAKELLDQRAKYVYNDRKVLRKKFKNDRRAYKAAKDNLRFETGQRYYESLEMAIRHDAALHSGAPVFERLWFFWHNHFAIAEKDMLASWNTGAYTREIIRPNMCGSYTDLVKAVTTSWTMIHHLDNSESVGPNSRSGTWRRENGKLATVNENHARELLELHTISPAGGYTQKDVIALSYIMAGWENRHSKKRQECNPVRFNQDKHQPGQHLVMGKRYKQRGLNSSNKLLDVIEDLCATPECARFVSTKLVRHFVTDDVTPEMVQPLIDAWTATDGHLPAVYKALVRVVYEHTGTHKKFLNPEVWFLQSVNLGAARWPLEPVQMMYDFKSKPSRAINRMRWVMSDMGHNPFRPSQPNGWPDTEAEWLSPELLIRRLTMANLIIERVDYTSMDYASAVAGNFDQAPAIFDYLNRAARRQGDYESRQYDGLYLFPSEWMLKV